MQTLFFQNTYLYMEADSNTFIGISRWKISGPLTSVSLWSNGTPLTIHTPKISWKENKHAVSYSPMLTKNQKEGL